MQRQPAHRIPKPMVAVVLTLQERPAPAHLMAIAVPCWDGVAQHPTPVAIWLATLSMAHATRFPKNHQSCQMASAVSTASSAQLVLVRRLVIAVIGLDECGSGTTYCSPETCDPDYGDCGGSALPVSTDGACGANGHSLRRLLFRIRLLWRRKRVLRHELPDSF